MLTFLFMSLFNFMSKTEDKTITGIDELKKVVMALEGKTFNSTTINASNLGMIRATHKNIDLVLLHNQSILEKLNSEYGITRADMVFELYQHDAGGFFTDKNNCYIEKPLDKVVILVKTANKLINLIEEISSVETDVAFLFNVYLNNLAKTLSDIRDLS